MNEPDEARLLRRMSRGDRTAFEEFYRRTSPWLYARLRGRCRDQHLVGEVLQDTYLAVWRGAGSFADGPADGDALGWLWTVAARRLVDAFRRESRHRKVVRTVAELAEPEAPGTEERSLDSVLSPALSEALAQLAPELWEVLRAMVLDGLSVHETSVLLGIPEGTVKTRARRARMAMRKAMS